MCVCVGGGGGLECSGLVGRALDWGLKCSAAVHSNGMVLLLIKSLFCGGSVFVPCFVIQ